MLLAQGVGLLRNEPAVAIPVKLIRKEAPRVRLPRPPAEIIPKLNTLAEHYVLLKTLNAEEVAVAALIGVVLLPVEVAPLERHLQEFGWDELVPHVRELVATALAHMHSTAHSTAHGTAHGDPAPGAAQRFRRASPRKSGYAGCRRLHRLRDIVPAHRLESLDCPAQVPRILVLAEL